MNFHNIKRKQFQIWYFVLVIFIETLFVFTGQRVSIVTTCFHKFLGGVKHWILHDNKLTPQYDSTPVCIVVENIVWQSNVIVATIYQNFVENTASSAFKQQNFILVLICSCQSVIIGSSYFRKNLGKRNILQFEAIMVLMCAFTYFWFPSHFVHIHVQLPHKRAKDCCCQVNHRSLS